MESVHRLQTKALSLPRSSFASCVLALTGNSTRTAQGQSSVSRRVLSGAIVAVPQVRKGTKLSGRLSNTNEQLAEA